MMCSLETAACEEFDEATLQVHRALLARMALGDQGALRELHARFLPLVQAVVRRIVAEPTAAEEIVQDVFIKAWQRARDFRPERGEVVSWIVLIARNRAIDHLRRTQQQTRLVETLAAQPREPPEGPADLAVASVALEGLLAQLSPAQRQALEMSFYQGFDQNEISAAMGITVGNVKNHLRRGLLRLRQTVMRHD